MGLGASAPVAAAHIVMILIIALTSVRLVRLRGSHRRAGGPWLFPVPIAMMLAAFGIERGYYLMARALQPYGYDLWSAHPAPALLSMVVALSCYWLMPPIFATRGLRATRLRRRVAVEITGFVLLGLGLEAVLR